MRYAPEVFISIYGRMFELFGPLSWWPAETPFEVCIGAILTQNTAWTNVEKAICNGCPLGNICPSQLS